MSEVKGIPEHLEKVFYRPEIAKVLHTEKLTDKEILMDLAPENRPLGHSPGQFIQLYLFGYGEAPISICSAPSIKGFQLCVRDVGNVTRAVHNLAPGSHVGFRGPYGRGFPVKEIQGQDALIVAGGIGLAPLRSLITHMMNFRESYGRIIVVYGAKNPALLLFRDDLEKWDADPRIELSVIVDEPDEHWKGSSGVVTLPIRDLQLEDPRETRAVVVGPPVMYKFVAMELFKKGFTEDRIFFSLERRFRCGVGKCGHCQLNDLYVCQDGPVFRYSDLKGRSESIEVWAPDPDQV